MTRTSRLVALALGVLLVPTSACAQDATVLVVLAAPPVLLAPILAGVIRHAWMRRTAGSHFSLRSGFALSALEFVLWMLAAWFAAVVYFQEAWGASLVLFLLLVIIIGLNRRLGPPQRSWLFSIALAGVFPAVWLLVQFVWYATVVWWSDSPLHV